MLLSSSQSVALKFLGICGGFVITRQSRVVTIGKWSAVSGCFVRLGVAFSYPVDQLAGGEDIVQSGEVSG